MLAIYEVLTPYVGYLALVLRVWVGANLVNHSRPKLGKGLPQAVNWMKSMGVPGWTAPAATYLELFGGIFLIFGLITPIVALLFIIQFSSIIVMKKTKQKAEYIAVGKPSYEVDVLYLMLSIVILVLGSGLLSIDKLIGI
jgi:putative oxidoreductase